MAIIMLDGYGKPRQTEREFREALERALHNEFGKQARLTGITRTAYRPTSPEVTLSSHGGMADTSCTDDPMVEE